MMRLLIVDDEMSIALGIEHIVRHMDTPFKDVSVAASGVEALRVLEKTHHDLALLDVSMPGMSGIELMRTARERGLCERFGILSGYARFQYAQEAMEMGCLKYLLKPVDREELRRFLLDSAAQVRSDRRNAREAQIATALAEGYDGAMDLGDTALAAVLPSGKTVIQAVRAALICGFDGVGGDWATAVHNGVLVITAGAEHLEALENSLSHQEDAAAGLWRGEVDSATALRSAYGQAVYVALCARYALHSPCCRAVPDMKMTPPDSAQFLRDLQRIFHAGPLSEKERLALVQEYRHVMPARQEFQSGHAVRPSVSRMIEMVEGRYTENLTLDMIAREISMSPDHMGKLFKEETGYSFHEYLNRFRVERIALQIQRGGATNLESLALNMGFNDVRSFHRSFTRYMGMTPGKYKKRLETQTRTAEKNVPGKRFPSVPCDLYDEQLKEKA